MLYITQVSSRCLFITSKKASKLYKRVVVLIDNLDSPLIDNINSGEKIINDTYSFLDGIFNILKGLREYLEFVFVTGVFKYTFRTIFTCGFNVFDILSYYRGRL